MADAKALLSVDDALSRVLAAADELVAAEWIPIEVANGRTLAAPLSALRTQPPFDASAMDGYAVRAADVHHPGATLTVIGTAPAGHAFVGEVGTGEAVRIFTGAPLPRGADTVVIQENTEARDGNVIVLQGERQGRHIRTAGLDFAAGQALIAPGQRLNPRSVALAAAMGHAQVEVRRKPLVAVLATGDELVKPGQAMRADQIVASNTFAISGMVEQAGGETLDLGIASDEFQALEAAIIRAEDAGADVLVTLGGASVGDHDLVQSALTSRGMQLGFWRIAMRPGKPLIFGQLGRMVILGLPGNPVSSIVCGALFLAPLLRALVGDPDAAMDRTEPGVLGADVTANDMRRDYVRAAITRTADGLPRIMPYGVQDSSMLRVLAAADCMLLREAHAPAAKAGDPCRFIRF